MPRGLRVGILVVGAGVILLEGGDGGVGEGGGLQLGGNQNGGALKTDDGSVDCCTWDSFGCLDEFRNELMIFRTLIVPPPLSVTMNGSQTWCLPPCDLM